MTSICLLSWHDRQYVSRDGIRVSQPGVLQTFERGRLMYTLLLYRAAQAEEQNLGFVVSFPHSGHVVIGFFPYGNTEPS